MKISLFQVDAFADRVFEGNPAAVCPLDGWLPDETLRAIAAENNLSETAFFVAETGRYALRWFTPVCEVDLCGHATLASAFVISRHIEPGAKSVQFDTRSGPLAASVENGVIELDFPSNEPRPVEPPPALLAGLRRTPLACYRALDYLVEFGDEATVRALRPDFDRLARLDTGVCATAPGDRVDFVSRYFAPAYGIPEDPVTGSTHTMLTPFWTSRLGRSTVEGHQLSARGGRVYCRQHGSRVRIAGGAVEYLAGTIEI